MRRVMVMVLLMGQGLFAAPAYAQKSPPGWVDRSDPAPVEILTPTADTSIASYPCPSLSGASGTSSQIYYTYTWINDGCPTPIRKGFYSSTGFGWDHINYRRIVNGLSNHETTQAAQNQWARALLNPGAYKGNNIVCHYVHYYTSGGSPRTMLVSHSHTNYENTWGRKGIITAYWTSGHVNPC